MATRRPSGLTVMPPYCHFPRGASQTVFGAEARSDWYLRLVKGVARTLREAGITKRIVFLRYFDTLWPPETEKTDDENLVFMYAPISRCYGHAICDPRCDGDAVAERPSLNDVRLPRRNRVAAEIVRKWQTVSDLDSLMFEYYRWAPTWCDGMGMDLGKIAARDMNDLRSLGLNGVVSNDCIRAFYPLPYLANAIGDLLWDAHTDPAAHRRRIMSAAFGQHAQEAESYFAWLIEMYRGGVDDYHCTIHGPTALPWGRFAEIAAGADRAQRDFRAEAEASSDETVKLSLRLLAVHAEQMARIARIYEASERKDARRIRQLRQEHRARLPEVLSEFTQWIDPLIERPVDSCLSAAERSCAAAEPDSR